MKQVILFLPLLLANQMALAQTKAERLLADGQIAEAVLVYSREIQSAQKSRTAGSGVDAALVGGYAYALALNQEAEAALLNIDRCRALEGKYKEYFTSRVLTVLGHEEAAQIIGKDASCPYILKNVPSPQVQDRVIHDKLPLRETLKQSEMLAMNGQYIQALVLLEDAQIRYPDQQAIYVHQSRIWEGMGYYAQAIRLLEGACENTSPGPENEQRMEIYRKHIQLLENKPSPKRPPQFIVYAGGTYSSGAFSLNSRVGLYTEKQFSVALNAGLTLSGEQIMGNLGVSGYKTWKRFLLGLGLNDQFSKTGHSFSISPLVGLTFPNGDRSASLDIVAGLGYSLSGENRMQFTVSIGRTVYFDTKKKKR